MKSYEDFISMSQDELYDYAELVGESNARMEFLSAWLLHKEEKEMEKLLKIYKWGD